MYKVNQLGTCTEMGVTMGDVYISTWGISTTELRNLGKGYKWKMLANNGKGFSFKYVIIDAFPAAFGCGEPIIANYDVDDIKANYELVTSTSLLPFHTGTGQRYSKKNLPGQN